MTYTPNYIRRVCKPFSPKKAVRSFRDLEVYQKTMELSVIVAQQVLPTLVKQTYPLVEGMRNCVLSVPLLIAEAHGMRFSNFDKAFSIEFCGGPHVSNTSDIEAGGVFKIQKEEASSAGIRRIKGVLVA